MQFNKYTYINSTVPSVQEYVFWQIYVNRKKTLVLYLVKQYLAEYFVFKKNLNASKPSEHPPQVEECLKV